MKLTLFQVAVCWLAGFLSFPVAAWLVMRPLTKWFIARRGRRYVEDGMRDQLSQNLDQLDD